MMKTSTKWCLLSTFLWGSLMSSAQTNINQIKDIDISSGPLLEIERGKKYRDWGKVSENEVHILLDNKDRIKFYAHDVKKDIDIQIIGGDGKLSQKSAKPIIENPYDHLIYFNNQYHLFEGKTLKENQKNEFYLSTYDNNGNLINAPKTIAEITDNHYAMVENSYYHYMTSEDESHLLLYLKLPETIDQNNNKIQWFRFIVYDKNMHLKWQKDVSFDQTKGKSRVGNSRWFEDSAPDAFYLMNDGTVIAWSVTDRGNTKKERYATDVYVIKPTDIDIKTIDGLVSNSYHYVLVGDQLNLLGLIAPTKTTKFIKDLTKFESYGLFMMTLDSKLNYEPFIQALPFKAEYLKDNTDQKNYNASLKAEKKGNPAFYYNFVIKQIEVLEDNSILIGAQNEYLLINARNNVPTNVGRDIYLLNIKGNQGIQWAYNIPANQYTVLGNGAGFVIKNIGGKIHVIFNDNYRNLEKNWNTSHKPRMFKMIHNPVSVVTFDKNNLKAPQKRQLLWDSKDVDGLFKTENYYSPKGAHWAYVVIETKGNSYRVMKLNFKP